MSSPIDWKAFRKCPVCGAETGVACFSLSGTRSERASKPHAGRELRTGYARTGGDR
jgi:hypothetical protein